MPHWMLKVVAQGAISCLPWRHSINRFIQYNVTKSLVLTSQLFEKQLRLCTTHLENYCKAGVSDRPPNKALELGTGWHPTTPIGLFLGGVDKVLTIDKTPLLDRKSVLPVLDLFCEYATAGVLTRFIPSATPERVRVLRGVQQNCRHLPPRDMLELMNIDVIVGDACNLSRDCGPIDVFVSNNTLEHIPAGVLQRILARFRELASESAVMSHFVDLSDHYAHFDSSLSSLNFLKYSDRRWRLYSNSLQYQNRLRMPDYRRLHGASGFKILFESNTRDCSAITEFAQLAGAFRSISMKDLQVTHSWIVSGLDHE